MSTTPSNNKKLPFQFKMVMDEVGADIEAKGFVPVTPETATVSPFSAKGEMVFALDEVLNQDTTNAPTAPLKERTKELTVDVNPLILEPSLEKETHYNLKNEVEGDIEGIEMDMREPTTVKDSLAQAFESSLEEERAVQDGEEEDFVEVKEELTAKKNDDNSPELPPSMVGEDDADEDGLVYITRIIEVDPSKYISNNYRPASPKIKNAAKLSTKKRPLSSSEMGSTKEPSPKEENELEVESLDEAIKGSDLPCFCYDEATDIDYSKVAQDIGVRDTPTRDSCQTTFAQCRAENPLYCRFHGPKLLEADLKHEIRARLARNGLNADGIVVSVERDSNRVTNGGRSLRFKVTVGCHRSQERQIVGQLDSMFRYDRPGFRMPGINEVGNARISGQQDDNRTVSQELEMDLYKADEPPRRETERRIARANAAIREENEQSPQPSDSQGEATSRSELPSSNSSSVPSTAQAPEAEQIEHLPGGVKARFSPSEKMAITQEMGNAIRLSNAHPEDLEAQSYAHALSHFLGSQNSSTGRRTHALAGIRDDITKAALLEKAENRLARDADSDNPAKYNGTVRAIHKIAEICGIEGLEIDGVAISISNNQATNNTPPPENESPIPDEILNRAIQEANHRTNAEQTPFEPSDENEPSEEEISEAARVFHEHAPWTIIADSDEETRDMIRGAMTGAAWDNLAPTEELRMGRTIRDVLGLHLANAEHSPVIAQIDRRIAELERRIEQERNREQPNQPSRTESNNTPPEANNAPNGDDGDNHPIPPGSSSNSRAEGQGDSTVRTPTDEDITEVANQIATASGYPASDIRQYLEAYLNGTRNIDSRHLPILNRLPENNPVRVALNRRWEEQESVRAEARQQEEERRREEARRREEIRRQEEARRREEARRMEAHLPEVAAKAMLKPSTSEYIPNQEVTSEQVEAIRRANEDFWRNENGLEEANTEAKRGKLTRLIAGCVQDSSIKAADDACVRALLPNVAIVPPSRMGVESGKMNPFTSNPNAYMNCYKGAIGALLRLRGYRVIATSKTTPNPALADSSNSNVIEGENQATYKATMEKYTAVYERIIGTSEESKAALKLMAQGDIEKGIAPYPDGTFVMTYDSHARVNLLFKGKWFRADPYGLDDDQRDSRFPGNSNARYIRPVSESEVVYAMTTQDLNDSLYGYHRLIDSLYQIRESRDDPQWNFPPDDNRRQEVLIFAMALARLRIRGVSISGRHGNRRPTSEEIDRCAEYIARSGDTTIGRYQSSIVIRPQDKLIPAAVGLTRANLN